MGCELSAPVSVRSAPTWVFWRNRAAAMTHQFFGLGERVLDISEAEAGHGDELAHHRHKLVTQLLRSLLLVLQFLQVEMKEMGFKKQQQQQSRAPLSLQNKNKRSLVKGCDSRSPRSLIHCAGCRYLSPAPSYCMKKKKVVIVCLKGK